jgi:photosystem II stability/assembly factor-like uncharacterized protein
MRRFVFSAILFSLLVAVILGCQKNTNHSTPKTEEGEREGVPNEAFFLQRSYPDTKFPLAAFETALEMAQRESWLRTSPPGFNQEWKVCGPNNVGARVNTIAVHPKDENIIYAGFSSGGLFKTIDGGKNWQPLMTDQRFLAIGAITIDPKNPEIVYVGTGDPNVTAYPFLGDGLYKTENGGRTWQNLGLSETRIITDIVINPQNTQIIHVGTLGLPFERNNQRGLYRSTDGGKTWRQTLFVANQAGIIDIVMDPSNPNVLYAASWDRIRNNKETTVAGPNAHVYKSTDGGVSWQILGGGLPTGPMSRIGLAIDRQQPQTVYALYSGADKRIDNIYRSRNGGQDWKPVIAWDSTGMGRDVLGDMGWYFGKIAVNPSNSFEIYLLGIDLWRSRDGGRNWELGAPFWYREDVHADKHALVYTPSGAIILGTDGGIYRSNDGFSWEDIEDIPTTQFYRVAYNPNFPNNYYGGTQDNGTLQGTVSNLAWNRIYSGDGFQSVFDPKNPNVFWVQSQYGGFQVTNNGGSTYFSGKNGINLSDRTNWDTPLYYSQVTPNTLYTGTYRVYRNTISPQSNWQAISGDLNDGIIYESNFHNISTVHESPLDGNLLYAGTSDANVWRTDDGGKTWVNITTGLPERYTTSVEASPSDVNTVYVTQSGYRDNDFQPHLFKSTNRGRTWTAISSNLPPLAINDLIVIPNRRDSILFAATDGGVYGTTNGGKEWNRLGVNMPIIPVYSLAYNPVRKELVAGTYGRSVQAYSLTTLLNPQTTATQNVVVSTSIELQMYPVPVKDELRISWNPQIFEGHIALRIFNSLGQQVFAQQWETPPTLPLQLSLQQFLASPYVLQLSDGKKTVSRIFVKE